MKIKYDVLDQQFEDWWEQNKESIMRQNMSPAKAAWDHLIERIVTAARLDNANMPGYISDALRGIDIKALPFMDSYPTVGDYLDAIDREDEEEAITIDFYDDGNQE